MDLPNDERSRVLLRGQRGDLTEIAEALGITRGAVAKWRRVPKRRVLEVEEITGISRHELRPDLYPPSDGVQLDHPLTEDDVPTETEVRRAREAINLLRAQGKPVELTEVRVMARASTESVLAALAESL